MEMLSLNFTTGSSWEAFALTLGMDDAQFSHICLKSLSAQVTSESNSTGALFGSQQSSRTVFGWGSGAFAAVARTSKALCVQFSKTLSLGCLLQLPDKIRVSLGLDKIIEKALPPKHIRDSMELLLPRLSGPSSDSTYTVCVAVMTDEHKMPARSSDLREIHHMCIHRQNVVHGRLVSEAVARETMHKLFELSGDDEDSNSSESDVAFVPRIDPATSVGHVVDVDSLFRDVSS